MHLRVLAAAQANHRGVGQRRIVLQHPLDVLGEHVLAVGQHDHLLDAASDVQEAGLVQEPHVAGLVPVAVERRRGLLRGVPVALGDIGAAHLDLAGVGDAYLDAGKRAPHRVEAGVGQGMATDHRRCLGGAVALQHVDAEQVPLLAQVLVQGRAAGDHDLDMTAEAGVHLVEQQPAQPHRQAPRQLQRQLPHPLLALVRHLALDSLHEQVQRLRHQQHHGDPALPHQLEQQRRLAAGDEGDAGAAAQAAEQRPHLLEHVAQGQQRQHPERGTAGDHLLQRLQVGQQVAVGQQHPLGVAGGAGGEHDLGEVVAGQKHVARLRQVVDELLQVLEQQRGDRQAEAVLRRDTGDERQYRRGLGGHLLYEVGRRAQVQRHHDGADPQAAEVCQHPVWGVRSPQDDPVALADAAALQQRRHPLHVVVQGLVAPGAKAEPRLEQQRGPLAEAARGILQELVNRRQHGSAVRPPTPRRSHQRG